MKTKIFINLPVANLPRTLAFWKALGFTHNPEFTDDTAACVVLSEEIYHMALTHPKWQGFTSKAICDTSKAAEVSLCLTCDSRAKVDELIATAVANGGTKEPEPTEYGFMYFQGFDDPDGHHWELVHMSAKPPTQIKS
ncbi:VOC family protein [Nibricoccus sp. IMCC34717]|uniref:VOC family protein n=1 Tax=Nibricoccus sp. IMCC34717 TaxID=3034021 RepID=UPI00384A90BC